MSAASGYHGNAAYSTAGSRPGSSSSQKRQRPRSRPAKQQVVRGNTTTDLSGRESEDGSGSLSVGGASTSPSRSGMETRSALAMTMAVGGSDRTGTTSRHAQPGTRSSPSESDSLTPLVPLFPIRRDSRADKARLGVGTGRRRGVRMSSRSRTWGALAVVTSFSAILLFMILDSFMYRQLGVGGCEMSYMYPSYIRLSGFGSEYTRLAGKYSLYLYREAHIQTEDGPSGVPVIFLPGNAGSFRQIRSIASSAAVQVHKQRTSTTRGDRIVDLDFFSVDFNEDFSAFHGQTMLEQAEYVNDAVRYILSLYTTKVRDPGLPDPSSVIVIGHSMGGIVARKMLLMPNFQPGSINTIITIGTPHSLPPVIFDAKIHHIYQEINSFWRDAYSPAADAAGRVQKRLAGYGRLHEETPLEDVILISIAGGASDTVISSDAVTLASLVPPTHGFTVFTTSIPGVWSAIDHQAVLWCDQFRTTLARSLLEIIDVRQAGQVKPRNSRLRILRRHFLTGLEYDYPWPALDSSQSSTSILANSTRRKILKEGQRLVMDLFGGKGTTLYLLPVPVSTTFTAKLTFSLLTDQKIAQDLVTHPASLDVMMCSSHALRAGQNLQNVRDFTDESLLCRTLHDRIITLPASSHQDTNPFSGRSFQYLEVDVEEMGDSAYIAIIDTYTKLTHGFLLAEFYDREQTTDTIDSSLSQTIFEGIHLPIFPTHPTMVTRLRLPALDSSLIAYHLKLDQGDCQGLTHFAPLLRQSVASMHESKFFVNPKDVDINLHAGAPFIVPVSGPKLWKGLEIMVWRDPVCTQPMALNIKMDLYGSLGKMVLRYRMALAALPFAIVLLVLQIQIRTYSQEDRFPSFWEGLGIFSHSYLPFLLVACSVLAVYQCVAYASTSLTMGGLWGQLVEGPSASAAGAFMQVNGWLSPEQTLLGNREAFLWFLLPLSIILATGLVAITSGIVYLGIFLGALATALIRGLGNPRTVRSSRDRETASKSKWKRRIAISLLLCFLVVIMVPFQFAFMVCVSVQFITCARARADVLSVRRESILPDGEHQARLVAIAKVRQQSERETIDRFNHLSSMLIFLLWLVPSTAPVLMVWIRNLSAHWINPFSSDHDLLSIAPFIFFVEASLSGKILSPRSGKSVHDMTGSRSPLAFSEYLWTQDELTRSKRRSVHCGGGSWETNLALGISEASLVIMASVCIIWGVRHTYLVYPMATSYIAWLVIYEMTELYNDSQSTMMIEKSADEADSTGNLFKSALDRIRLWASGEGR